MCVWGGKLEAYQLLQTSGKEAFLSKRSEQLGGQIQNVATGLRVRTWCFPPMAELQQLGRPRVGILRRKINQGRVGGQVPAVWLSLPCTASVFDIGGDSGLSSPASSQCQVACHPSRALPGALIFLQELMSVNCQFPSFAIILQDQFSLLKILKHL